MRWCQPVVRRDENRRQIHQRWRHEAHPLLVAVRPAAAVQENQHRRTGDAVAREVDIEPVLGIGTIRHIEQRTALLGRRTRAQQCRGGVGVRRWHLHRCLWL